MDFLTRIIVLKDTDSEVQLPDFKCNTVTLLAKSDNSGAVNFGPNKGTFSGTNHGFPLFAGKERFLEVDNANQIWLKTAETVNQTIWVLIN